jgi:hypothetical protein
VFVLEAAPLDVFGTDCIDHPEDYKEQEEAEKFKPLLNQFRFVLTCCRCSAKVLLNVDQVWSVNETDEHMTV